jgi:tetratricopeptide (TPR) repeat protein
MDVECLKYIAQTYQNMGDMNKAKEYYEKANKIIGGKQN